MHDVMYVGCVCGWLDMYIHIIILCIYIRSMPRSCYCTPLSLILDQLACVRVCVCVGGGGGGGRA